MMLFREHFAAPEDLDIRLVDYKAWKYDTKGVYFHTLWTSHGRYYMCDHVVTLADVSFWDTARMSDLIECAPVVYFQHVEMMTNREGQ